MKNKLFLLLPVFLLTGCDIVNASTFTYKNANAYIEYSEPIFLDGEFTSLDLNWITGDIVISEGEKLSITETNLYEGYTYYPLYYLAEGNSLTIQYCKSGLQYSSIEHSKKRIELVLPSSLINVNLDLVSANYTINLGDIKDLNIDVVSGNGDVSLNSVEKVDVDTVSGNFTLNLNSSLKLDTIDIDVVSGSAYLYFDGLRGYNLSFSSVSGKVIKEFENGEDPSLNKFNIKFDSVSGNLNIKKNYNE